MQNHTKIFSWKKIKLRFFYEFKSFQRNWFKYLIIVSFIISMMLSSAIILPNLFTHRLFMIGIESPRILRAEGLIFVKNKEGDNNPLAGSTIEIGGYKTHTDQDGRYQLRFLSMAYENIPVVIQSTNGFVIKRITFRWDEYKKTEEFILDEK